MNDDMKVNMEINLEGNLQAESRRNEQALGQFSQKGQRHVHTLASSFAQIQKHFGEMTERFAKAGGGMLIASRFAPAIKVSANLQEQLIGVKTELMSTVKNAAEMEKAIKQVGDTAFDIQAYTPFDQTQVVALEKALIKGGAQIGHVVGKSGATAAAAALAVQEEMAPEAAGNALIGIAGPFKIAADGYMKLANSISAAGSASITGAADIAESAKYAAGPMAALGRSADEMFAISALMANRGIVGSSAGTGMANFFRKASQIKQLQDKDGNLKSTDDIVKTLQAKTAKMGDAEKIAFLTKQFGDEGMPVALALLDEGGKSLKNMLEQMLATVPLQDKMNERLTGFNAQWEGLKGTTSSTFATLFEPALKPLTDIVKKTGEWVGMVGKLAGEHKELSVAVTAVAAAVTAAGAAYAAFQAYQGGKAALNILKALKGAQSMNGGLEGGMGGGRGMGRMGAIPVYIVDGPMSVLPDSSTPGEKQQPRGKSKGLATTKKQAAIKAGNQWGKGAVLLEALNVGATFLDPDATPKDKTRAALEGGGGVAGAWAGGATGAAIGSIFPVIGTAIGGALGAFLGSLGGHWLGGEVADATSKNTVDLTVKVEGAPGTTAQVTGMRSSSDSLTSNVYYGQGVRN